MTSTWKLDSGYLYNRTPTVRRLCIFYMCSVWLYMNSKCVWMKCAYSLAAGVIHRNVAKKYSFTTLHKVIKVKTQNIFFDRCTLYVREIFFKEFYLGGASTKISVSRTKPT